MLHSIKQLGQRGIEKNRANSG